MSLGRKKSGPVHDVLKGKEENLWAGAPVIKIRAVKTPPPQRPQSLHGIGTSLLLLQRFPRCFVTMSLSPAVTTTELGCTELGTPSPECPEWSQPQQDPTALSRLQQRDSTGT